MQGLFAGICRSPVSGEMAEYSTNTDEVLESTFSSKDGATRFTVTCLASEGKMIVKEETR